MKARFTLAAELELQEAIQFYEQAQSGLGAEVEATTQIIERHPLAWMSLSSHTRRCRTHRFLSVFSIKYALSKY